MSSPQTSTKPLDPPSSPPQKATPATPTGSPAKKGRQPSGSGGQRPAVDRPKSGNAGASSGSPANAGSTSPAQSRARTTSNPNRGPSPANNHGRSTSGNRLSSAIKITSPNAVGSEASIHAPGNASGGNGGPRAGNQHRKSSSGASTNSLSASPSTTSTLNPNAGGFLPGLHSLTEVQREELITPIAPTFDASQTGGFFPDPSAAYSSFSQAGNVAANLGTVNNLQQQLNQLQQLQLLQSNMAQPNNTANQQLVEMQQNLLAQMQLASQSSNIPPRFQQQQLQQLQQQMMPTQTSDMDNMMAEQMAIQQQLETLRAQQDALLNRFAEMQTSPQQLAQSPPSVGSGFSAIAANAARAGHRRHQSQQSQASGSMGSFGGFSAGGAMGQFGLNSSTGSNASNFSFGSQNSPASAGQNNLPKGHGRRHSVNVVKTPATSPAMATSPPVGSIGSTPQSIGGFSAFQFPGSAGSGNTSGHSYNQSQDLDLDYNNMPPSVSGNFAPGHGRRESRGSISSMSGWGTTTGQYVQNAIPSGTTTDLAQAQAQLQQLTAFRAASGHAKVPSFGLSTNQNYGGNANYQQGGNNAQQRKSLFAPYLPAASIPPLVAAGKLVVGALRVNKRNRSDAYVATDLLDSDIYICGSKDRNRALEGDVVAVELLDVDEVWGTKKEKEEKKRKKEENASYDPRAAKDMRKADKKNDDVEVEGQGMTLFDDEEVNDDQRPQYAGHVVGVVHRAPGQLFAGTLGVLRPSSAATKEKQDAERRDRDGVDVRDNRSAPVRIVWLRPVDKRVPLLAIPVNEAPADFVENSDKYANRLFCACIKRWPITSLHPFGTLVEELGEIGDIETETSALLKDCNFSAEDFSDSVMKCLPPIPFTIPPREYEVRRDLRELRVFTIDPETAKDLDDALHISKQENGTFEVGVHIADVSHFIKPNSPLDREARKRATTVYLVQRAYPMLPPALSESICTLTAGEDKLAFSVVFTMNAEGKVLSTWFGKTVIKSCAKLAYADAQAVLDGKSLPETVSIVDDKHDAAGIEEDLKALAGLAQQLSARRFANGALRIDNIKLSFRLDEAGLPQDCRVAERREANKLIEEFMLLANTSVAQKIAAGLPEQAMLRRHEGPIERRMDGFAARAQRLGFSVDISTGGALMKSFQDVESDQAALTLQLLATKAMNRAKYFCSGMLDISKYHHYALNVPLYTHFTSPIRRYADVIVHRQLDAILLGAADTKFNLDTEGVSQVAQHCNIKKDAARLAQEQSQHLFLCVLIANLTQQYGPVVRLANVIGVLDEAFDVVVPDFGIEKRVHIDQMPIENHVYDEHNNTLAIYWKKGVDVMRWLAEHSGDAHLQSVRQNAERHAKLMEASDSKAKDESALFADDDEVTSSAAKTADSQQHQKSASKAAPVFEGVEVTSNGHHVQTIKELQKVPVIVTADMSKSPPIIKVISLNPFPK